MYSSANPSNLIQIMLAEELRSPLPRNCFPGDRPPPRANYAAR